MNATLDNPRIAVLTGGQFALVICMLAFLICTVWSNSLNVPFMFDDRPAILENSTLRPPLNLFEVLSVRHVRGAPTDGRPLVNLSLAINYVMHEQSVSGYHIINIAIHLIVSTLMFLCLVHLLKRSQQSIFADHCVLLAALATTLWAVHPLQTSVVTYISQRAESLASMFYLLGIYGFFRSIEEPQKHSGIILSLGAALLGVVSKETIATLPLVIYFIDALIVSRSWSRPLRDRGKYYLALFGTWIPLAGMILMQSGRSGTAGFEVGVSSLDYLWIQGDIIISYLLATFGFGPVIFDYGMWELPLQIGSDRSVAIVGLVGCLTIYFAIRRSQWAIAGIWFFLILAPSSSLVPVATQVGSSHRMYLPSMAPICLLLLMTWWGIHRFVKIRQRTVSLGVLAGMMIMLAAYSTYQRNQLFQEPDKLWMKTWQDCPSNSRALHTLSMYGLLMGEKQQTLNRLLDLIDQTPDQRHLYLTLANCLTATGQYDVAVTVLHRAIEVSSPPFDEVYFELGDSYLNLNDPASAVVSFTKAIEIRKNYPPYYNHRARGYQALGKLDEAIVDLETSLELSSTYSETYLVLGDVYLGRGETKAALENYRQALNLNSELDEARESIRKLSRKL